MGNNRSGISHPALNTAGGSALWTSIDDIYQTLSDNDVGRWEEFTALANGATLTLTHGFGCPFDDVRVIVYTGTYPNLTQNQSFVSAANATHATTKVDITAPASGGPFSGYVLLVHGAGGSGGGTTVTVSKTAHGFAVGDVLYLNGSTYTKAKADAANTAEVVGVVSKVNGSNAFELTLSGVIKNLSGLVAGEVYFLSASTAGSLTLNEPTTVGHVSLPVGVASSTTTLYVAPKRGVVVGGANARTQISLANNTTTTVQDVSGYEAGELSGWIAIAATTPLKFYVSAKFSKNGAGNNYNISYQTSGDTPPVGLLLQVTSAGLIQAVLPSITGFASASITYGLDVAAIGTSYPLSVDAGSITTGTFTRGVFSSDISTAGSGYFGGSYIDTMAVEIGVNRSSDGTAYVDLTSQESETDFNARLIRNAGVNGDLDLVNKGTGNIKFTANFVEAMKITPQGVQIRGRTDGAAVQAGYIGESVSIILSGTPIANGTWTGFSGQNITLTRGIWILIASISINVTNCSDFSSGLATNFSNDSSNLIVSVQQSKPTTKQTGVAPLALPTPYIVSGSSQIVYLKTWMGDGTLGPVSINGMFIRIA
jgi:hypothetical protein